MHGNNDNTSEHIVVVVVVVVTSTILSCVDMACGSSINDVAASATPTAQSIDRPTAIVSCDVNVQSRFDHTPYTQELQIR